MAVVVGLSLLLPGVPVGVRWVFAQDRPRTGERTEGEERIARREYRGEEGRG